MQCNVPVQKNTIVYTWQGVNESKRDVSCWQCGSMMQSQAQRVAKNNLLAQLHTCTHNMLVVHILNVMTTDVKFNVANAIKESLPLPLRCLKLLLHAHKHCYCQSNVAAVNIAMNIASSCNEKAVKCCYILSNTYEKLHMEKPCFIIEAPP